MIKPIKANSDSVYCGISFYPGEVAVEFHLIHVTSLAKPTFPFSVSESESLHTLASEIAAYLRSNLPSTYEVTVSFDHRRA